MPNAELRPVANGSSTDHPVPGLPFVDDAHVPVHDPAALEAVGRHSTAHDEHETWGRHDPNRDGGWTAYTTDPRWTSYAWVVRWHPTRGRSVLLFTDELGADAHGLLCHDGPLLWRAGHYWWDGQDWHRPAQVFDWTSETYLDQVVPAAVTVTAADQLAAGGTWQQGRILSIDEFAEAAMHADSAQQAQALGSADWFDDLAAWAHARQHPQVRRLGQPAPVPLEQCVVTFTAPELAADQLLGVSAMAEQAGIAASTLRAYISRGQDEVPAPQATLAGRDMWSRPVVQGWVERRRRSPESVRAAMSTGNVNGFNVPPGVADIQERFTRSFTTQLWERPDHRKRWALRWRNQTAVHDVAAHLAWTVAGGLRHLLPMKGVQHTLTLALKEQITEGLRLQAAIDHEQDLATADLTAIAAKSVHAGIAPPVAKLLGWLVSVDPNQAARAVQDAALDLGNHYDQRIPIDYIHQSIAFALSLDSTLGEEAVDAFLALTFITT